MTTLAERLNKGDKYDPNTICGCLNRIANLWSKSTLAETYNLDPEADPTAWKFWKLQEAAFWPAGELDFSRDREDYEHASPEIKRAFEVVNGFFVPGDGLIIMNIALRFALEAKSMAETGALLTQMKQEFVHAEVYRNVVQTTITDRVKRDEVLKMVDNLPCVKAKAVWMEKYMYADIPKGHRVVAFACTEGIFFWSLFSFVFWLRSRGIFVNFVFANVQISKDESMHRDYGCVRFRELAGTSEQIPYEDALEIIKEAVEIEDQFADIIAPTPIEDFSAATTKKFNRFMANNLLIGLGYDAYWLDAEYPSWMQSIASSEKGNFYEVNIGAYKQFAVGEGGNNDDDDDSSIGSSDDTDI